MMSVTTRARIGGAFLALALALLAGCPRHGPIARPYAAPTVAELLQVVRAQQAAVRTMNARARATSWLGGDRIRATVLMLVDREGRLRLEAEVSLQGTVAVLATDGARFEFLDLQHNELRRGPACPANVASLIRIPLAPAEVAAILLGDARLPALSATEEPTASGVRVEWDGDARADVLDVPAGAGRMRYLLQRADARAPVRLVGVSASDNAGQPIWRAAYEDFVDVPAGASPASLPSTIRYAEGNGSFDDGVEIKFKERSLNETPAAGAFAVQPAPGIKTIDVACP